MIRVCLDPLADLELCGELQVAGGLFWGDDCRDIGKVVHAAIAKIRDLTVGLVGKRAAIIAAN
jgi:hypothetical protein